MPDSVHRFLNAMSSRCSILLCASLAAAPLMGASEPGGEAPAAAHAVVGDDLHAVANTQAERLRTETLALIDDSRLRAGKDFAPLARRLDESAGYKIGAPLVPLDLTQKKVREGEVWRLVGNAYDLHRLALAYSIKESAYYQSDEAARRLREETAFVLTHFQADGSLHAVDYNVDRFVFTVFFDAVILEWPVLPEDLRREFVDLAKNLCAYQQHTYRDTPVAGRMAGYPNMDAAYLLIVRQVGELLNEDALRAESVERTKLLADNFTGSTYDYLKGWPSDPGYTQITLLHLGRYWQLSHDPEALRQIRRHQDYYKWFLEPDGQMDYGISPPVKHVWHLNPFAACNPTLELVQLAAPSPVLRGRVEQMRSYLLASERRSISSFYFYWLTDVTGPSEPFPRNFLRDSEVTAGYQMRQTTPLGTWTAALFGRKIGLDTRVSVIATPAKRPPNATVDTITVNGIAGAFLEIFKHGASFYEGDMTPEVVLADDTDGVSKTMTVVQTRKSTGPTSRPMMYGKKVGVRTGGTWTGGLPERLPVETEERWTVAEGRLEGEFTVTARAATTLDEVRLSLVPLLPRIDEKRVDGATVLARYGTLCVALTAEQGHWHPDTANAEGAAPFHFRVDLPDGLYDVSLTGGDADFVTEPFTVDANGKDTGVVIKAAPAQFVTKTFRVKVTDRTLLLRFHPSPNAHWKINAIAITRASDGAPVRFFDVGPASEAPVDGYQRLTGAVYTSERGYGWAENYTAQERSRTSAAGVDRTLITSASQGLTQSPVAMLTDAGAGKSTPKDVKEGTVWKARVKMRQAASLAEFETMP